MAPSGGRDRPDPETGKFVVSPYDPKSVEVFRLMAAKAKGRDGKGPPTHFFPFTMWTNKLVPPPDKVRIVNMWRVYVLNEAILFFKSPIGWACQDRASKNSGRVPLIRIF